MASVTKSEIENINSVEKDLMGGSDLLSCKCFAARNTTNIHCKNSLSIRKAWQKVNMQKEDFYWQLYVTVRFFDGFICGFPKLPAIIS